MNGRVVFLGLLLLVSIAAGTPTPKTVSAVPPPLEGNIPQCTDTEISDCSTKFSHPVCGDNGQFYTVVCELCQAIQANEVSTTFGADYCSKFSKDE